MPVIIAFTEILGEQLSGLAAVIKTLINITWPAQSWRWGREVAERKIGKKSRGNFDMMAKSK